ncbi:hypothetical protein [Phenylobacterium sp.]|uniref:hypothetical protein n=1 Tax=Phenylobacterium sp. TaxID=1871053 RepID=UPI002DF26F3F|nr:hypothetical protein [Phenylobacterium sp.]
MSKIIGITLLAASVAACASTQAISPRSDIIDRPTLNSVAEAELGDTIVEKGKLTTYDALLLKNQLEWGDGVILKKFVIPPGKLRAQERDANFIYYYSSRMTSHDALLGTFPYPGGLCAKEGDTTIVKGFIRPGVCTMNMTPKPIVEHTRVTDVDTPGFRQELIYNGRSGDTIKFLYREFAGDLARPPFSQDVQYDLKDSKIIGFKGVRVEVLDATNTHLSYRVLSTFPTTAQ